MFPGAEQLQTVDDDIVILEPSISGDLKPVRVHEQQKDLYLRLKKKVQTNCSPKLQQLHQSVRFNRSVVLSDSLTPAVTSKDKPMGGVGGGASQRQNDSIKGLMMDL